MTVVSWTVGGTNKGFYRSRTSSGADGFTKIVPVAKVIYKLRIIRKGHFEKIPCTPYMKFGKVIRTKKTWIPPIWTGDYITVVRNKHIRTKNTDHAYTATHVRDTTQKGTNISGWMQSDPGIFDSASYGVPALSWSSNDQVALIAKLGAAIRGHSFQMGVAIAEGRETMDLCVGTARRFGLALLALRKGRVDLALRQLGAVPKPEHRHRKPLSKPLETKDVSSLWLEIQYGWKPLLSDIHESMNAYTAITDKPRSHRFSAIVSAGRQEVTINYSDNATPSGAINATARVNKSLTTRVVCTTTEQLDVARSLGLLDPLSIAWEVVPFSFVADWFVPIGTYFDALNAIPRTVNKFVVTSKLSYIVTGSGTATPMNGASYSHNRVVINRSIPSSLSVPLPTFKPLPKALSAGHLWNALALIHQQVR